MHLAACRKLLAQREEAQKRAEALKQQAKEEKESTASGEKRKRKAATKLVSFDLIMSHQQYSSYKGKGVPGLN